MDTTKQEGAEEQVTPQPVEQPAGENQENSDKPKQDHHHSATYAANQWESAVKHVQPHHRTDLDN